MSSSGRILNNYLLQSGQLPVLELTDDMQLPPDFDRYDPVEMWDALNNRDLVAEVRHILSRIPPGPSPLDELDSMDLARHLQNCGAFWEVHIDTLQQAVAKIRNEYFA